MLRNGSNITTRLRTIEDVLKVASQIVRRMSFVSGKLCLVPHTTTSVCWSFSLSKLARNPVYPQDKGTDCLLTPPVHLHQENMKRKVACRLHKTCELTPNFLVISPNGTGILSEDLSLPIRHADKYNLSLSREAPVPPNQ